MTPHELVHSSTFSFEQTRFFFMLKTAAEQKYHSKVLDLPVECHPRFKSEITTFITITWSAGRADCMPR